VGPRDLRHEGGHRGRGLRQRGAPAGRDRPAWRDRVSGTVTLERAAELGKTDEMKIYSIIASDSELASTGLWAFAGFFDRRCPRT